MTSVAERSMGLALRNLNRLAGLDTLDRLGIRNSIERIVYRSTREGFRAAGQAARTFAPPKQRSGADGARLKPTPSTGLFDLTPTDEQQFLVEAVRDFADNRLRKIAGECETGPLPDELFAEAGELGLTMIGVPEEAGGAVSERSAVLGALVAESLAHGDAGLAVALLAPSAVATALAAWGDADQQEQYLAPLVSDDVPVAALALAESRPLADPLAPATTATPVAGGYRIDGHKALVPRGEDCELLIVGATIPGHGPGLFIVEATREGVLVDEDPAMGIRGAKFGRIKLDGVTIPGEALLAKGDPDVYRECVARSELAWAAIGAGVCGAVRDYVIPYVNERVAFGEPISHRQAVAFMVSDIAIETEGLHLTMLRAAARADAGLSFRREVALARNLADRYGSKVGSDGVQLLGGHGFTQEYPVERWFRDLRATGILTGAVLV